MFTRIFAALTVFALLSACTDDDASGPQQRPDRTAAATIDWINGDGKAALVIHRAARLLVDSGGDRQRCQAIVDSLDDEATPNAVLAAIARVPDTDLQGALLAEEGLFRTVASACLDRRESPADLGVDQLNEALVRADRRLARLVEGAR